MLWLGRSGGRRRIGTLTASTFMLAAAATGTVGTATAAHASTCGTWSNIRSPGNLTVNGNYAGQVEEMFYGYCSGGGAVEAHFQRSGAYQGSNSKVTVLLLDSHGNRLGEHDDLDASAKDRYSYVIDVHASTPDEYQAAVFSDDNCPNNQERMALGSLHWYYNGGDYGGAQEGWCW